MSSVSSSPPSEAENPSYAVLVDKKRRSQNDLQDPR